MNRGRGGGRGGGVGVTHRHSVWYEEEIKARQEHQGNSHSEAATVLPARNGSPRHWRWELKTQEWVHKVFGRKKGPQAERKLNWTMNTIK